MKLEMEKNKKNEKASARKRLIGILKHTESGLDGILVTIGLCVIALVLCAVLKDSLTEFIRVLTESMTGKAQEMLAAGFAFLSFGL